MAEPTPELDDFFAKKDRKKSKKKFPAVPSELLTKKPEPNSTLSSATAKKIETTTTPTSSTNSQQEHNKDDEGSEWLDYKEEQEKDYSGLKLRQLAEPEPEPEEEDDENAEDLDAANQEPAWKAVAPVPEPAAPVTAVKEDVKGVYISPALRNAALLGPSKLKSKAAPDLSSDSFFPALGTEPPKPVVPGKLIGGPGGPWSAPRLGPQKSAWGQPAAPSGVSLGNRFNTLDDTEES